MAKLLPTRDIVLARFASAFGVTALAFVMVGLVPFLGAEPSEGASFAKTPAVSVDRTLKGDRLPLPSEINSALSRNDPSPQQQSQQPGEIPDGCDASFSPITAPLLAHIYGRCTT